MKKKIFILVIFLMFIIKIPVSAISGPSLVVNDNLKKCGEFWMDHSVELLPGWHSPNTPNTPNKPYTFDEYAQTYCESIGYTYSPQEKVSQKTNKYINFENIVIVLMILHFIAFIILIVFYYRIFIKIKRRYIVFFLCSVLTLFALKIIFNTIYYYIKPQNCAHPQVKEILLGPNFSSCA